MAHRLVPLTPPTSFRLLLWGISGLCAYMVHPFGRPLFLACVLALAAAPLHLRLSRLWRGHRQLAAAVLTLALLVLFIAPVASSLAFILGELTAGLAWLREALGVASLSHISWEQVPAPLAPTVAKLVAVLHLGQADLERLTSQALYYLQHAAPTVMSASMAVATNATVVLIGFFFLLLDGDGLVDFVTRVSPLQSRQTAELLQGIRDVSSAALLGTAVTSLMQGLLFYVGFALAHIPHAIFFGLVTVVAGFVPVLGAALVAGPAAIGLALSGRMGGAIALSLWCLLVTFVADNIVKPILLRGRVEMHTGLVLLALLGGIAVFGLVGIIAGPLVMASCLSLWRIYERDFVQGAPPLITRTDDA